ncbi:unnamed protein product [Parajaminaea phylloscopi]
MWGSPTTKGLGLDLHAARTHARKTQDALIGSTRSIWAPWDGGCTWWPTDGLHDERRGVAEALGFDATSHGPHRAIVEQSASRRRERFVASKRLGEALVPVQPFNHEFAQSRIYKD